MAIIPDKEKILAEYRAQSEEFVAQLQNITGAALSDMIYYMPDTHMGISTVGGKPHVTRVDQAPAMKPGLTFTNGAGTKAVYMCRQKAIAKTILAQREAVVSLEKAFVEHNEKGG